MDSLNVGFGEDELEALRRRAELEGMDVQQFVHDAAMNAVDERSRRFREAADHVSAASEELNRRLA